MSLDSDLRHDLIRASNCVSRVHPRPNCLAAYHAWRDREEMSVQEALMGMLALVRGGLR